MNDKDFLKKARRYAEAYRVTKGAKFRLPAFDAMRLGLQEEREEIAEERATKKHKKRLDLN